MQLIVDKFLLFTRFAGWWCAVSIGLRLPTKLERMLPALLLYKKLIAE